MKTPLRIIAAHAVLALIILVMWLWAMCLLANAQQADARPILRVWSSPSCGPCIAFWRDFTGDSELRQTIEKRYKVVHVNADHEPPVTRQRYGVNGLPTFEAASGVNVLGYCGKRDLLDRLKLTGDRPSAAPSPIADLSALESRLDTLSATLDELKIDRREKEQMLIDSIGRNAEELAAIASWIRTRPEAPDLDAHAEELNTLRQRVDDLLDRLNPPTSPQPSPTPVPTIARSDPTAVDGQPPGTILGWLVGLGLTLTQAAGVGGSIATGGGIGIAFAAVKLFAAWRRRRDASPVIVPAPAVPGPTTFAAYPVDRLSAAFDFAKRELAAKYPGAVATLETLDSLVQQHLAGTATNPKAPR